MTTSTPVTLTIRTPNYPSPETIVDSFECLWERYAPDSEGPVEGDAAQAAWADFANGDKVCLAEGTFIILGSEGETP